MTTHVFVLASRLDLGAHEDITTLGVLGLCLESAKLLGDLVRELPKLTHFCGAQIGHRARKRQGRSCRVQRRGTGEKCRGLHGGV